MSSDVVALTVPDLPGLQGGEGSTTGRRARVALSAVLWTVAPQVVAVVTGIVVVCVLTVVALVSVVTFSPSAASGGGAALRRGSVPAQLLPYYETAGRVCPEVSAVLLAAQDKAESGFNPSARSPVGASGIAQFMPATAAAYGLANPLDPAQAIPAQARMMCDLAKKVAPLGGDQVALMLAAYNAGPYAVIATHGVPPYAETRGYIANIKRYMVELAVPGGGISGGGSFGGSVGVGLTQGAGAWGGFANGQIPPSRLCPVPWAPGRLLRCDAGAALARLDLAFRATHGSDLVVTDAYRSYADQVAVGAVKPGLAAVPGTSNHGWGLAVDLGSGVQIFGAEQHDWMVKNAGQCGWVHPAWAEPGGSLPEPWHWEYVGG